MKHYLSPCMLHMRAVIHFTLGISPGSLTFNRDMFLNMPLIVDCGMQSLKNKNISFMRIFCVKTRNEDNVGALKNGYIRKVTLPRAPRIQFTSHMQHVFDTC